MANAIKGGKRHYCVVCGARAHQRRQRQKPGEELCELCFEERYRDEIATELAHSRDLTVGQELTHIADRIVSARIAIPWGTAPRSAWKDLTVAANRLRKLAKRL